MENVEIVLKVISLHLIEKNVKPAPNINDLIALEIYASKIRVMIVNTIVMMENA